MELIAFKDDCITYKRLRPSTTQGSIEVFIRGEYVCHIDDKIGLTNGKWRPVLSESQIIPMIKRAVQVNGAKLNGNTYVPAEHLATEEQNNIKWSLECRLQDIKNKEEKITIDFKRAGKHSLEVYLDGKFLYHTHSVLEPELMRAMTDFFEENGFLYYKFTFSSKS